MTKEEYREKVYKYKQGSDQVKEEARYGYVVESIEINNGIYSHIMGMEYPEKGIASTEDIFATNAVKKIIIESLKLWKYLFLLVLSPTKTINAFNTIAFRIMSPQLLQFQHLTPMAQELSLFLNRFLIGLGINGDVSKQFTEIFVNIINFDNAYRYRIQDIFNETSIEQLRKPRKEFKRLLDIYISREIAEYNKKDIVWTPEVEQDIVKQISLGNAWWVGDVLHTKHFNVSNKFALFFKLISFILIIPKVKKSYLQAIKQLDIDRVKPDRADWFWMCIRTNYHYLGKTNKERLMLINELKYVIPTKIA